MLPAASAPVANPVPARTSFAGRALQVMLLLGGFLVLALILSAQAHADAPDSRSATSATAQHPALVVSLERGAEHSVRAGKAQADRSVDDAVAAATASDPEQPAIGLVGTVHDITHQMTTPVTQVIGTIGAGHGGSVHGTGGRRGSAPRNPGRPGGVWFSFDARATGSPAGAFAGHHARTGHGDLVTPSRAPGQLPLSAQYNEHPVESDGGAHHTGGAYAAVPAAGARAHLSAAALPSAHGSAPLRRTSDVSVNPD